MALVQLYSEFAEPLELLEIILLIFHVSDHRDPILVEATWEAILARGESATQPTDRPSLLIVFTFPSGRGCIQSNRCLDGKGY